MDQWATLTTLAADVILAAGACNCLLQTCEDRHQVMKYHGHQVFPHDVLVDYGDDHVHEDRNLGTVMDLYGMFPAMSVRLATLG
jgi:hypothetical protein